jgi:preprotein translocase subunit YajC
MKERDVMLNAIRKNDEVVTSSGIIGRVHRITKEQEIVLEIDSKNEVQIRVLKSAIMTIRKKSGEEDEEAKPEDAEKTKQG